MTEFSTKAKTAIERALDELPKDNRTADTAVIDGLIMAATAVKLGYPVSDDTRRELRKALTDCTFGKLACELLGPP
jgi:hypothetical protein